MREIKFRLWDKKNKKFILNTWANPLELLSDITWHGINQYGISYFDIENIIISQYTGLKDKNGKEIYEGDIVTANFMRDNGVNLHGVVEYDYECCSFHFCGNLSVTLLNNIEVIGNIYKQEGGK